MLESEHPDQLVPEEQLLANDESVLHESRNPITHTPLPFEKSGETPKQEVVVDLRDQFGQEPLTTQEAPPIPSAVEPGVSQIETVGVPPDDHYVKSAWHRIAVNERGETVQDQEYGTAFHQEQHPESAAEFSYAAQGAGAGEDDDEVAVASGQLAVSTITDDASKPKSSASDYADTITSFIERASETLQDITQRFGGFTAFDAVLWAILFLIIIAIIIAIRA